MGARELEQGERFLEVKVWISKRFLQVLSYQAINDRRIPRNVIWTDDQLLDSISLLFLEVDELLQQFVEIFGLLSECFALLQRKHFA